jgi:hypothetical protein
MTSALFFTLATITRSMMATYLGVAGFLIAYLLINVAMSDPERRELGALIEPLGLAAWSLATRYFTAADANTLTPPIEGALLSNRLIWTTVGVAALALALRSRDLPRRARNVAMRAVLRRFVVRPWYFILPERSHAALQDEAEDEQDDDDDEGDDAGAADGESHQASLVQSDDLHHQASRHVA